jgi:hypothetical protein
MSDLPSRYARNAMLKRLIAPAALSLLAFFPAGTAIGQNANDGSLHFWTDTVAESEATSLIADLRKYKKTACLKPAEIKNRNHLASHATDVALAYQSLIVNQSWSWPEAKRNKASALQSQLAKATGQVSQIPECPVPPAPGATSPEN